MSAVPLPSGFQVRQPTMADLTAVFALITACEVADYGAPDTLVDDLREAWQGHDLAADAIVVRAPDHAVVGLATIEGQTRLHAEVYVHPAYRGPGLAAYLEGWLDTRAHARAALVADHAEVVLDRIVNGATDAAGQQLRAAGYTVVCHHWRMRIDLALPLPAPAWPPGIRVRTALRDQDERAVHAVLEDAWADAWDHTPTPYDAWCTVMVDTYRYDPAVWWIAEAGAQIAGVAVGVDFPDMGWVRLLGVRRPWRRQGIALALLRQAFQEFKRRGQRSVGLGVDAASPTGATELYRRAGMRIDKQFAQYRKIVRSGA